MSGGLLSEEDTPRAAPSDRPTAFADGGQHGEQAADGGATTTTNMEDMNAVDRLLAGTAYNREDVDLALSALSTLILLYWAMTEVR